MVIVDVPIEELANYREDIYILNSKLSLKYDILISIKMQDSFTFNRYKDVLPFYSNIIREGVIMNEW